jgi:hypothetical protein
MTNLIPFPGPAPKEDEPDYAAMISNPYEISNAERAMNEGELKAHIAKLRAKSLSLKKEAEALLAWEKARVPNKP